MCDPIINTLLICLTETYRNMTQYFQIKKYYVVDNLVDYNQKYVQMRILVRIQKIELITHPNTYGFIPIYSIYIVQQ